MMSDSEMPTISVSPTHVALPTCGVCRTPIVRGEPLQTCPECGLPFHSECWQENSGCSQYGCLGAPAQALPERPSATSQAWGDSKPCPACGQTIKARALRCRYCGASWPADDPFSRSSSASQARQHSFAATALFMVAGTGCLAPVVLALTALMLVRGRGLGIDLKTASPLVRTLVRITCALSGFLTLVMVSLLAAA